MSYCGLYAFTGINNEAENKETEILNSREYRYGTEDLTGVTNLNLTTSPTEPEATTLTIMATLSGWDTRLDTVIRQVSRDIKRNDLLLKGSISNKRATFLNLLKTALTRHFPTANIIIVRHGQVHRCLADHVVRKVQGPVPVLSDFFGFGSYDYHVYVCRRGSFTNFGHGGPLDLVWAGPTEVAKECGYRSQTLLLR